MFTTFQAVGSISIQVSMFPSTAWLPDPVSSNPVRKHSVVLLPAVLLDILRIYQPCAYSETWRKVSECSQISLKEVWALLPFSDTILFSVFQLFLPSCVNQGNSQLIPKSHWLKMMRTYLIFMSQPIVHCGD